MRVEQIAAKALKKLKDDRYKLALVVAKRAEELANGAEPLVNLDKNKYKYTDIALHEIAEDKIVLEGFVETSK
ncbi:TPA: DNA-directed RNA polymerase subunit omega [Campylobacter lari]|uniref:DNA-directed RNA polymerase subunit omega n=2 Tax=Campylobacter lari TaxID=201 RepID=RPOZ_CAMLR|nr:DNA-directed RNA polymerase subunit omega [Campylobacter lari]B9KFW0.1 RecName: Full=DNA-directed RNA polymerase subunit omega; Short=RNAP omega subunit; AltName: Full=RNA polymerase omega subunit; AltName: Full=Transcriptase subunit omega [Campylobacter lari RM2100]ACM63945.1 DNA-directed RNA polymerase, omega subunit [Campylobacter lari RM2100]EAH4935916.1 DNA-directed RNA polymerase subunit omega [Campylobacter lari]EAH5178053.1 DNA-directed RNA polymerase subunit omega [Campylobacter lar